MNKKFDIDKWPDYLVELAATNPQQLPLAMFELMKQRLMLAVANQIRETRETMQANFSRLEEQLRKELDISSDKEDR